MYESQRSNAAGLKVENSQDPKSPQVLTLFFLGLVILGGWAYWPTLRGVWEVWSSNPDYSHGYFVPILAIFFLWIRQDLRPTAQSGFYWGALSLMAVAGLLRFAAGRFYLPELDGWSIPVWLGGIVWLFYGRKFFTWTLPAIGFLWFATPLPATFELLLSTELQLLAAQLGSWVLRLLAQPAFAEGTTILLNDQVLDIERACSGLRMFYGILALSVACVVLARLRSWAAIAVLAASVPVALVTNVVRIVVTGILLQKVSGDAARKFSHDLAGFVMIPIAIVLFVLLVFWIRRGIDQFRYDRADGMRWLLRWSTVCAVGLALLFFWHGYQQNHIQAALLELAEHREDEQDWIGAATYLQRYQRANPKNQQVAERFAEAYAKSASRSQEQIRSVALLYKAWKNNPSREDLALQAGRTALELGESRRTLQICEELVAAGATEESLPGISALHADSLLLLLESEGTVDQYSWHDVAKILEATQESPTSEIQYRVELAWLWQEKLLEPSQKARTKRAQKILDTLVVDKANHPMAWLARHQFHVEFGAEKDDEAEKQARRDLTQALTLVERANAFQQATIYSSAASFEKRNGDIQKAQDYLTLAIAATPADPTPVIALAELYRVSGVPGGYRKAIDVLRDGLKVIGEQDVALLLPLASLLVEVEDWTAADECLRVVESSVNSQTSDRQQLKYRLGAGLIRSQISWQQGGVYLAIRNLESLVNNEDIRIHRSLSPKLFSEAHLLLGELYDSVGMIDRASEQMRTALQLDPRHEGLRNQVVFLALEAGDLESAELHCRQLLREDPKLGAAWAAMIRIHVRRQIRQPPRSRDWTPAQRTYDAAIAQGISKSELLLAELEMLDSRGESDAAVKLLQKVIATAPKDATLRRELALLLDRSSDWESAIDAADEYLALLPKEIDPYVLKATLLEKAGRSQEAQTLLTELMRQSTGRRWVQVAQELASLQLLLGKVDEAKNLLEKVHQTDPTNLRAINSLANIAWVTGDWSALELCESWLREVEGGEGTLWRYYRAQRLLDIAESAEDPRYEEVWRLSKSLQDLRPRWSKTDLLLGDIALRSGQIDAAITSFERAWSLGDRSAFLADRLIDLLTRQGRFNEAQGYVSQVRNALSLSSHLLDRSIPYFAKDGDLEAALKLAEAWVVRQPHDATSQLRLGRILQALALEDVSERGQHLRRAELAFRAALKLAPEDLSAWLAFASLELDMEIGLQERLDAMSTEVGLAGWSKSFVFARMHNELGQVLDAHSYYREAIELANLAEDKAGLVKVLAGAAEFYLAKVPALAECYARAALAIDPGALLPREMLLQVLSLRREPDSAIEALALVDAASQEDWRGLPDHVRRVRAELLSQLETEEASAEATSLLETLLRPTADDKRLLAVLYEQKGRIGPAFEILSELARPQDALSADESTFLRFWQDNFLAKATGQAPPSFVAQATDIYQRMLSSPPRQSEWLRWKIRERKLRLKAGRLSWPEMQVLLATLQETNQGFSDWGDPARLVWCRSVLQVLLDEDQLELALAFAKGSQAALSGADLGIALCHAMILSADSQRHHAEVNVFLGDTLKGSAQRGDLARAIGDYQLMTGQYELAAESYRASLQTEPDSLIARNNLVLALAELPGQLEKAYSVLEEALSENPTDVMLLDTRALLLLIDERPADALELLSEILSVSPEDATAVLREAMAYHDLGERALMQDSYLQAMSLGIDETLLSPRDRAFLQRMAEFNSSLVISEFCLPAIESHELTINAD